MAAPRKYKMDKHSLPKIPTLVRKRIVNATTLLVALDDPVITRAKAEDKAQKEASSSEALDQLATSQKKQRRE